jgi:SAM-dependent methyltransferase
MAATTYKWLAQYYDRLFNSFNPWSDAARAKIVGPLLPGVKSACDLCCGTGRTALLLAGQGIRMFAVDITPAMCRQTREKARAARLPVRVIRGDMRDFRLPQPVDLVLCEFDALNHVERKSDLARVASCVSRALRPGAHFYFDVNTRRAFEEVWPGTWFHDGGDFAVVMHGGYDRTRDKGWTEVEWFLRNGRHWVRRKERVEQVSWTPREMRDTLRQAGFDRIRAWDATPFFGKLPYIHEGCRTIYLARKSR